jgi:hypothetical protein
MTGSHGTYTDSEMAEAVRLSGETPETPREPWPLDGTPSTTDSFGRFVEGLPSVEGAAAASASTATVTGERKPETVPVKTDAATKALNAKMAKLKRQIAKAYPKAVEGILSKKGPGWAMSEEQKDILADSIESVFEMLDIQFQIEQLNVELKSRLWIFLYPVAALLMILAVLAGKNVSQENPNDKPDTATV